MKNSILWLGIRSYEDEQEAILMHAMNLVKYSIVCFQLP